MKLNSRIYRTDPPATPEKKDFNQNDNFLISWYIEQSSGGGGGNATAANQVLQLAQETITAASTNGLNGFGSLITLSNAVANTQTSTKGYIYPSLAIQLPAGGLTGAQTILVEISMTSGAGNFRTLTTLDLNTPLYTIWNVQSAYQVRFTYSGTGTKAVSYWLSNFGLVGDATAANQVLQYGLLDLISEYTLQTQINTGGIKDNTTDEDSYLKSVFKQDANGGISVFKTKNDSDPGISVFTNATGEVSVFANANRTRSVYDEAEVIKQAVTSGASVQVVDFNEISTSALATTMNTFFVANPTITIINISCFYDVLNTKFVSIITYK